MIEVRRNTYRVRRVRRRRVRRGAGVRVGAPDESLTRFSGLAAVTELVERLGVIRCPGSASTTAAGLARKFSTGSGRRCRPGSARYTHGAGPARRGRSRTPPMWRSTAGASRAWRSTTRASGSVARTWPPGPIPRRCWPRTWVTAATTPARPAPSCWAGRWPRCPPRRGPGGSGCARTPATSPGSWPAPAGSPRRLFADVEFAIGARRIAPLWRMLDGVPADRLDRRDRHDRRPGRRGRLLPELVARRDPAADPPGPARPGPRPGVRRSAGAAAPHPAPRAASAALAESS